jgi:hypothetical protein
MAHQVNFYAAPEDIAQIEAEVRQIEPIEFLHSRSQAAGPRVVSSLDLREDGTPWLFFYLVRESDLAAVVTNRVPAQGYWTVDVFRSPVVEFNRCYFDGNILRRGRVYYVDGFYRSDEIWVEKSEYFRRWAKSVFKITKRCLKRHGTDYIGQEAWSWLNESARRTPDGGEGGEAEMLV